MSYISYLDFNLTLRSVDAGSATIEVTSLSAGDLPPVSVKLPTAFGRFAEDDGPPIDTDELQALGVTLFDCLFPPTVRGLYRAALARLPQDRGLRLRLQTDSAGLAAIPWEYAYDSETATWPALDPRTLLVRYYALPFPPSSLPRPSQLRVLVVLAAPSDLAKLDLDGERRHIDAAFHDLQQAGRVQMTYLESPATAERLQNSLRQGVDVLHYVGHGTQQDRQGALLLERDDRSSHLVLAEEVALLVHRTGIRLICLNACLTGAASGMLFGGLGPALVRADIPAVVAMQYAMPDQSALRFTRAFYSALADGEPVDAATTAARVALRVQYGPGRTEWGYPILFMRAADGHLWADQASSSPDLTAVACPTCGKSVGAQSRFCSNCGVSLKKDETAQQWVDCPACGRQNRPQSRFCGSCGASLTPEARQPSFGVQISGAAKVTGIVAGRDANITMSGGNMVFGQDPASEPSSKAGAGSTDDARRKPGNG